MPTSGLDDEVSDPFEELIEAGDESQDQVETTADSAAESPSAPRLPQQTLGAAPALTGPPPDEIEPSRLPGMGEVRQLFSQLEVRREQNGRVVIEAPAEAASTLERPVRGHGRPASVRVATRELMSALFRTHLAG